MCLVEPPSIPQKGHRDWSRAGCKRDRSSAPRASGPPRGRSDRVDGTLRGSPPQMFIYSFIYSFVYAFPDRCDAITMGSGARMQYDLCWPGRSLSSPPRDPIRRIPQPESTTPQASTRLNVVMAKCSAFKSCQQPRSSNTFEVLVSLHFTYPLPHSNDPPSLKT
jgi:hypothetical protein